MKQKIQTTLLNTEVALNRNNLDGVILDGWHEARATIVNVFLDDNGIPCYSLSRNSDGVIREFYSYAFRRIVQ